MYGIDMFRAQNHNNPSNYESIIRFKEHHSFDSVHIFVNFFVRDFAPIAMEWQLPVDILHIDGTHTHVCTMHHNITLRVVCTAF